MGTQIPSQKGGGTPQFSIHVYCGQTAAWIKMPLGTDVGLGPDDIVLDGDPAWQHPLPKKGAEPPPHFSAHFWATVCKTVRLILSVRCLSCLPVCLSVTVTFVHCGQTVGRIMQVGLGPGHIVLRGTQLPLP